MPADGHPRLARSYQRGPIDLQRYNGCPPGWGQADHAITLCRPGEMFRPDLMAWVEEQFQRAREGIAGGNLIVLVLVAERAGQPEVIFFGLTA